MDDLRKIQAAARIREIRALQLRASRIELAAATREKEQHITEIEDHQRGIDADYREWSALLSAGGFDHDALRRRQQSMARRQEALGAARARLADAEKQRTAAAEKSGEAQVRAIGAAGLLRRLRQRHNRKAAEQAMRDRQDHFAATRWRPA